MNISNILGIIVEAITKGEMSGALKIHMKNTHEKYTWKIYMKNIQIFYSIKTIETETPEMHSDMSLQHTVRFAFKKFIFY